MENLWFQPKKHSSRIIKNMSNLKGHMVNMAMMEKTIITIMSCQEQIQK